MSTANNPKTGDSTNASRLEDVMIEINCFNCENKEICIVIDRLFPVEFKTALAKVASHQDMAKFYEAVEKMLARICQSFQEAQ